MRKIICLFTLLILLFTLTGCGAERKPAKNTQSETSAEESTTAETVTAVQYENKVKANGYDITLLPEGFVARVPEGLTVVYTAQYDPNDEYNYYARGFTRLRVSLAAANLPALNSLMSQSGWTGQGNFYTQADEEGTTQNWIEGYWKKDGYVAYVADSDENTEDFTLSVDMFPYTFTFPKQLAAYFPVFDGVSLAEKSVYSPEKGKFNLVSPDKLTGKSWRWEFNGDGVFIGVTEKEAQSYAKALEKAGFSVHTETDLENDFGSYVTFTAEKTMYNKTVFAQFLYAEYAHTLMAVYTNDYDGINV